MLPSEDRMGATDEKRVLFVCYANANRSQIAEAFARIHAGHGITTLSAGVRPAATLDERAVAAMAARGYDLRAHRPRALSDLPQGEDDAVVTMGCDEQCPSISAQRRFSWNVPRATDDAEFSVMCDWLEHQVQELLANLRT